MGYRFVKYIHIVGIYRNFFVSFDDQLIPMRVTQTKQIHRLSAREGSMAARTLMNLTHSPSCGCSACGTRSLSAQNAPVGDNAFEVGQ